MNYPFIFGFKEGSALGHREVLLVGFGFAVLALASILANLDMEMDPKTGNYKRFTELLPLGVLVVRFDESPYHLVMLYQFHVTNKQIFLLSSSASLHLSS